MAPLPQGEGGSLVITAPQELCIDTSNEFHLHQIEDGTMHVVLELTAGPSACEWTVARLRPGTYESWIQAAPNGRILARGLADVSTGATTVALLQRPALEIKGRLTRNGGPPKNLVLRFAAPSGLSRFGADPSVDADGWYQVTLDGQLDRFCAFVSAPQPANTLMRCEAFYGGVQEIDLDVAPGVIHITIPPIQGVDPTKWSHIRVRSVQKYEFRYDTVLTAPHNNLSFKAHEGYRADYIGLPYGDYILDISIADRPDPAATARVSVSPEQEATVVEIVLP